MSNSITHRLLQRQIRRHFGEISNIPESWHPFIAAIDQTYQQADDDLTRVEHTLEVSSQELLAANVRMQALLQSVEQQVADRTEELQRSLESATLLQQVTAEIRSTLDSKLILQTIVQKVRSLLQTDRVVIYQFTRHYQGEIVVEDVADHLTSLLGQIYDDVCFPQEYAQRYHKEHRVRVISDITQANLNDCHVQFLQDIQVKANLVVPINIETQLWGLLIAHECKNTRDWKETEVALLQQLADQAAISIQQAELYEQSQITAETALQSKTQLEAALEELQLAQMKLIQNEKMSSLGQLVAGIAHEVNNPINFIHGNLNYASQYAQELLHLVQLYQQYYPNPAPQLEDAIKNLDLEFLMDDFGKLISSMQIGVDRIRQIVLSLRNFSRMDEAEMKVVNIHDGIDSTLLILQHRLETNQNKKIQIIRSYQELPLVECYAGQLNQVFMNVLSNAIDALEESPKFFGQNPTATMELESKIQKVLQRVCDLEKLQEQTDPTIWIQTELTAENQVTIRFLDNGTGIPATVKSRLFDPFFTTKPVGKGTGLGLSISYQIIHDRHRGCLACNSVPGLGTEFMIAIPVQQTGQRQTATIEGDHSKQTINFSIKK